MTMDQVYSFRITINYGDGSPTAEYETGAPTLWDALKNARVEGAIRVSAYCFETGEQLSWRAGKED